MDTNTAAALAIADADDLLTSVSAADLRALLEIAREQMDCVDEDEATGYGIDVAEAERLRVVATSLLAVLG